MTELEVGGMVAATLAGSGTVGALAWWAVQRLAASVLERLDRIDVKLELASAERSGLRTDVEVLRARMETAKRDG